MPSPMWSEQAILNAAYNSDLSALRMSPSASIEVANSDAGDFRVSAIQDSGANLNVSAKSSDAGTLRTSAVQGDAGLFRVSALGVNIADVSNSDAADFRVSAIIDNGSVSAKSSDGGTFRVSGLSPDAATFLVSAKQGDATNLMVSGKSQDGALFRVSAIQDGAAALNISAKSGDGGTLRVSAIQDSGANLNVSAKSDSANLFRVSSLESVTTTATGGASLFSTSAGIAQVSTVKSSGGRIYGWHLEHGAGVDQFVQVFNASGGATLGTDVPTLRIGVPAGTGSNVGAGAMFWANQGIGMATGIQIAVTSTPDGNTAGASAMRLNFFYA